jgi:hypothetical protein
MNTDLDELVREGMHLLAAETRAPADVVARARRHVRRQKNVARAALACGTAAVAAVVLIAVASLSTRPGTGGATNARTTAYVIRQVEQALGAEHFVIQGRATGSWTFSVHGHQVRGSGGKTVSWTYGKRDRTEEFTLSGKPWLADGTALIGGKLTGAYVTYYDHKYSLYRLDNAPLKACSATAQLILGGPAVTMPNWPAFIRAMLGCEAATVTGHARIDGVETTVISGSIDVPLSKGYGRTVNEARAHVRYTLYVDSVTYLPVRAYGSTETHGGTHGPTTSAYVTTVRWLPPTTANIAKALVTIPPGYTQVNSPADQQPWAIQHPGR